VSRRKANVLSIFNEECIFWNGGYDRVRANAPDDGASADGAIGASPQHLPQDLCGAVGKTISKKLSFCTLEMEKIKSLATNLPKSHNGFFSIRCIA